MRRPPLQLQRGTVSLVALCFVAVLGITLTGYIAVCSRAMNLSNRTFQAKLSQQLAEMGLDEAMRAFNKNNWADWANGGLSADWTVSGTTATCTLTFPAAKFGQGVTGSVKIRIDNYNANQLDSTWNSATTYRINDLVGRSGIWYRCVQNGNTNKDPSTQTSLAWWVPAPIPWAWSSNTAYTADNDVVCSGGTWYRCIADHTSGSSFAVGSNWSSIPAPSLSWNSTTTYAPGAFVYNGAWYRCLTTNTNQAPPNANWTNTAQQISWRWRSGFNNSFNDVVYYSSVWYRYINSTSANVSPPDTTYWENALSGSLSGWSNAGIKYNLGDAVYYSATSQWYRCLLAHTSSGALTPTNTTCWSNAPLLSTAWDPDPQYSQNDTARYNGVWYLSLQNNNVGQNPATATTYWIGANTSTASYQWNATTAYAAGVYRCYGGVWYQCLAAHTNQSPNHTTYWSALGAPVVYAEGTIAITGSPAIKTQLRATLAPAPLFPNAAAATTTLTANIGGTVDSYDATTGVSYASQVGTSTNYSAVVAAGGTSGTAMTLSGALTISGYVAAPSAATSPYAPLFSYGTSTIVKGSAATPSPKVDLSRVSRSPYIPQFDTLPIGGLATNWATTPNGTLLPTATTVNLGTPGATTPSRYYYPGDLNMGGGSSVITTININGPVILYINGDLILNGSPAGKININDKGSAEIHASGGFRTYSTSDGINNQTLDAKRLILISDNTSAPQFYNSITTPLLYSVIYAPNTTAPTGFQFNSGGASSTTLYGAISAAKITYTNDMNIHYDTSLRYATFGGVDQPCTVTEWRELPVTEQATMP